MRTTVTLDTDVEILVRQAMRERGLSFKQALNLAVRAGLGQAATGPVEAFRQRTFDLGRARVDLTKALALAGELDDQAVITRYQRG